MSLKDIMEKQHETQKELTKTQQKEEERTHLVKLIELYLNKTIDSDKRGRISPSSGCSFCPRQAFYSAFPHKRLWQSNSELYAKVGVASENFLANGFSEAGILYGQSLRLWENEALMLGAEMDLLIKNPKTGHNTIVECKTCGDLPASSKGYQLWQLQLYMAYYLTDGFMYYISRDVADNSGKLIQRHFFEKFSPINAKQAIVRSFVARKAIDIKKIPPIGSEIRNPTPSNQELLKPHADCGFCEFARRCWYGEENEFAIMSQDEFDDIITEANFSYCSEFFSKTNIEKRREDLYNKLLVKPDKDTFMKSFSYNQRFEVSELVSV